MARWKFVKDAGKPIFGTPDAAEAPVPETPAPTSASDSGAARRVEALRAELRGLDLDKDDLHLTLRGDTVRIDLRGADRETLEKLVLAVGNIEGIAWVEADLPAAERPPLFHTVRKDETLSTIAKAYLGKASKYNAIFQANQPMLSDPDAIYPGQTLRIPRN